LGKPTSRQAITACLVILLGFVVGSYGEINFSWIGILSGVASSCFVALYGIYVKKTLAIVENNEWYVVCLRRPTWSKWTVVQSMLMGCQCAVGLCFDARSRLLLHYNTAMAVFALLPLVWLFGEVRRNSAWGMCWHSP